MNLPAAIVILVLLLFGPLALHLIERNIEVYALALGILATLFAGGFEPEVVKQAVTEPILISVAVIAAGLVFGWTRDSFERLFAKLRRRIPRAILAGAAILVLAALSSLITAIVAALVLVEIARLLHLERSAQANVTIAGCFAIGLGAALTPIGEPLSTLAAHALGARVFRIVLPACAVRNSRNDRGVDRRRRVRAGERRARRAGRGKRRRAVVLGRDCSGPQGIRVRRGLVGLTSTF